MKSIIKKHSKASHELLKTIILDEKVGSNSSLCSDTIKVNIF